MAIKRHKPTSPGVRGTRTISYRGILTTTKPEKSLTKGMKRGVGRNNQGRITTRHKGGGHKRRWREIDFLYNKIDIPAKVQTVEYDPNRTAFIALLAYADGEKRYILAPQSVSVGDKVMTGVDAPLTPGNRLPLKNIPVGTFVYNIELKPNGGSKLVRGAGSFAQVVANDGGFTSIKLPSSEVRKVKETCFASIGEVSNPEHKLINKGKAGRNRWLGIRPTVRGSAMNPVDHPHGGGEGRSGISLRKGPKTRQGKQAYGVKTRKKGKYSDSAIVSRRKNKKRK